MRGSTYKRCSCAVERDARGNRKACKKAHGSWVFVADLGISNDGRRLQVKRGGFATKVAAEEALSEFIDQDNKGMSVHDGQQTVAVFLDRWIASRLEAQELGHAAIRATTALAYQQHIRDHLKPSLGHLRLKDLRLGHVQDMINALGRPNDAGRKRSPATVRRVHATLRSALKAALRQRLIAYNPAVGVELPSESTPKVRPWEPAEVGAFLDLAASDELGSLFEVAALTGLRRGELCGLRWIDVDLERQHLTVRQQAVQVGLTRHIGKPKTASGEDRVVALAPQLVGALIAHQLRQEADRQLASTAWQNHEGLVFTRADGSPWMPNVVSDHFRNMIAKAGLRRIRFHDLRHGTASLALANGVDMAVVSKMLGHSTVSFTTDRYTHLLQGVGSHAAAAIADGVPRKIIRACDQFVTTLASDTSSVDDVGGIVAGQSATNGGAGGARTHDPRIMSPML
jgi:integrase